MLERLLYTALTEGIAEFTSDPDAVRRVFSKLKGLTATEAARITDLLRRLPPEVIHNYPREDSKFPLYAIILGEDPETMQFLDDGGAVVEADEAEFFGDPSLLESLKRTSIFTPRYDIWVTTESPDMTIAYYQVAKYILGLKRSFLKAHGFLSTNFNGGDLSPNASYLPHYLFTRRLSISAQFEEPVFEEVEGGIVRSVTGIYTDDGSTGERVGGVRTLATPVGE